VPLKATVTRLGTPALIREPSRATGSLRSSRDSTRVPSGISGTCEDGAPAVTTWSTTNLSDTAPAAISAAAVPPCAEPTSITRAPGSSPTAVSMARTTWRVYDEVSAPTRRSRPPSWDRLPGR
jgi:hypothetical protein